MPQLKAALRCLVGLLTNSSSNKQKKPHQVQFFCQIERKIWIFCRWRLFSIFQGHIFFCFWSEFRLLLFFVQILFLSETICFLGLLHWYFSFHIDSFNGLAIRWSGKQQCILNCPLPAHSNRNTINHSRAVWLGNRLKKGSKWAPDSYGSYIKLRKRVSYNSIFRRTSDCQDKKGGFRTTKWPKLL